MSTAHFTRWPFVLIFPRDGSIDRPRCFFHRRQGHQLFTGTIGDHAPAVEGHDTLYHFQHNRAVRGHHQNRRSVLKLGKPLGQQPLTVRIEAKGRLVQKQTSARRCDAASERGLGSKVCPASSERMSDTIFRPICRPAREANDPERKPEVIHDLFGGRCP